MIGAGGFKAHDARLGPKLGASVASGLPRLARAAMGEDRQADRVEAARARVRAAELERRAGGLERLGAEQGAKADAASVKAGLPVSGGKRDRGRPRVEGVRPWEAAGVSRARWYRDRKREEKGEGR